MPIMILLVAILLGIFAFGLVLCAIEEKNPFYWPIVALVVYACMMYFLKFLAMC